MYHLNKLREEGIDWENNTLSHALFYAQRYGWQIIPLHYPIFDDENRSATRCSCGEDHELKNRGKHPRYDADLVPEGLKSASSDPELIKEWWRIWPQSNIGIVTGKKSNLIIIDADGITGKREIMNSPHIPMTACAKSGVGLHYYFNHPGGDINVKTTVKVMPGVDSRGDGGYIIAPPSLHYNGYRYEWLDAVDVADAPQWWLDLVEKPKQEEKLIKYDIKINDPHLNSYARKALEDELAKLWSVPHNQGLRNKALYDSSWAMFRLVGAGFLDDEFAYNCLLEAATQGMNMKNGEAIKTIRSGRKWGIQNPRQLDIKEGRVVSSD